MSEEIHGRCTFCRIPVIKTFLLFQGFLTCDECIRKVDWASLWQ